MMRLVQLIFAAATLAGCVSTEINPVSPAEAKLQEACDAGDVPACQSVLAKEASDRAAYRASINAMTQPIYTGDGYQVIQPTRPPAPAPLLPAQQQVCPNGRIIAYPGICPAY